MNTICLIKSLEGKNLYKDRVNCYMQATAKTANIRDYALPSFYWALGSFGYLTYVTATLTERHTRLRFRCDVGR